MFRLGHKIALIYFLVNFMHFAQRYTFKNKPQTGSFLPNKTRIESIDGQIRNDLCRQIKPSDMNRRRLEAPPPPPPN